MQKHLGIAYFVLGSTLVYQLCLLHRFETGSALRVGFTPSWGGIMHNTQALARLRLRTINALQTQARHVVLTLIALVILAGLVYSYWLSSNLRYQDEEDYYSLALHLVTRGEFTLNGEQPTATRPPAYAFLLSLLLRIGAEIVQLRAFNFVLFGGCILLIYLILREQFTDLAGAIGPALIVCYPVFFYTAGTLFPQTFGAFIFLLILCVLSYATTYHPNSIDHKLTLSTRPYVIIGFLFGLLLLAIPAFVFSLLIICIWTVIAVRKLKYAITILTIALLTVSLWSVRNYFVFRSFVFISTNAGIMLLAGNSENTTANSGITTDIVKYTNEAATLNELQRDTYYRSKAIEFIRKNPRRAVQLYLAKAINYFNYYNNLETKGEESSIHNLVMLLTYYPLLSLAILRIVSAKYLSLSKFEWLLILLYIGDVCFSAVFFTRIRYRLPADFLLIALSAQFIANLLASRPWWNRGLAYCADIDRLR